MDIHIFSSQELDSVFRVLRSILNPSETLLPAEQKFLETYAKITNFSLPQKIQPLSANRVSIEDPHKRKRLIQLSAMAVLLSNPIRKESLTYLKELSQKLSTQDPVIKVIEALSQNKIWKARLLTIRRGMRSMLKEAYLAEGWMGIYRFFIALFFRARVNKDKNWNFKKLGLLPDGTLGREYWKHITELGFGFPGEPNGIPDTVVYHDIGHVLADNDTTPLGEIQQGSFQGGNRREDGFFFIQFVILQFHHGVKITPVAAGEVGNFDPEKVLWAIHRGAKCAVDITHQWNFWPLMPLPIEEARKRCELIPKLN
jgi:hypothetical protein